MRKVLDVSVNPSFVWNMPLQLLWPVSVTPPEGPQDAVCLRLCEVDQVYTLWGQKTAPFIFSVTKSNHVLFR